jgi:putative tryptophan/tyrosine transport system substrate-binding protein
MAAMLRNIDKAGDELTRHDCTGYAVDPVVAFSRRRLLQTSARLAGLGASAAGLALLGGCQLTNPPPAVPARVRRIGGLYPGSRLILQPLANAFADQLRLLGWVEGENLAIEWRVAEGRDGLLTELAADLVRLPVEVIFAVQGNGALAAKQQTNTIPIVCQCGSDPVAMGLVGSLARPGGNITGISLGTGTTDTVKAVELLKTVLPRLSRLAILEDQSDLEQTLVRIPAAAQTAERLRIQILDLDVRRVEDVDGAFETAKSWNAEGLLLLPNANRTAGVNARVVELAAQNHLPAMYQGDYVVTENGGLMAFGVNIPAMWRYLAGYVDKILRGASPADLPVEEPREWQFIVNVKAAEEIGITFPPDAAVQVTRWFQ